MGWSACKPLVTTAVFQAARRGELLIDAPISWLWPEFAAGGKRSVTIRDVLQHRSGLDIRLPELVALTSPRVADVTARLRRRRSSDARPHYQVLAYGVILGEVLRRATGLDLGQLVQRDIFTPLGGEGYLGLPPEHDARGVYLTGSGPFAVVAAVANTDRVRRAPIASGGWWTTPETVARFYDALGRTQRGEEVLPHLQADDVIEMTRESFHGRDGVTSLVTRWGTGIQLGVDKSFFGTSPPPGLFGHNGSNIAIGWYDPASSTAAAIMCSHILPPRAAVRHLRDTADSILRAE